jgi:uncharacterized protein
MIRSINTITCIISILLFSTFASAQTTAELDELKRTPPAKQESEYITTAHEYNSEYDFAFGILFIFYKKYVSSQDASSCSFTPSCSEYALIAIKKQGIFVGIINFWDRFSRCNGMSAEDYPVDYSKKVLIDPVRDWHYHEK